MKHQIPQLWLKTKTPEWRLGALGVCAGILGAVALVLSLCFYFLYEYSGVSGWVSAEVVADVRSLLRLFAFGVVPLLGAGCVAISFGIREYRAKLMKLQ